MSDTPLAERSVAPAAPSSFIDVRSPAAYPDSPVSRAFAQPLMLGLFLPIQAGGWSASRCVTPSASMT